MYLYEDRRRGDEWHQRHRYQWNSATVQLRSNTGSDRYASIVMNRALGALIVISLIVSGSVASTLRWFIRLATESQDPLTTSWSPVIAPLQWHLAWVRFKLIHPTVGTSQQVLTAIRISLSSWVVNPLLHNVLPASYVTHRECHQSVIPSVYRLAP